MDENIIRIKKELKKRGLNYDDLANISGVSKSTLTKVMAGISPNPRIETVQAMLKALNLDNDTPSFGLTELEQEIIGLLREMTEHQQMMVLAYMSGLKDKSGIASQRIETINGIKYYKIG